MKDEIIDKQSYKLHFIKTKKFKTVTISVNFREKIIKEDITKRKMLFQLLTSCTKKYNTSRLLEIKLEDLYSTSIGFSTIKFGSLINSYIDIIFLNEKHSEKGLTKDALDFLFDIIFNPNASNNMFDKKMFDEAKNRIEMIINSEKENIQKYAFNKALYYMDKDDPSSFNLWGNKEDLDKITPSNLYSYYKNLLKTNMIDIFVVGDVDKNAIIKYFDKKFKINTIKKNKVEAFITYNKSSKCIFKEEEDKLRQSHLAIVCKMLNLSLFERRYVLPLYSSILGGGGMSRLFSNVREKNSLAYSIMSMSNTPNSLLLIYAGVNACDYGKAIKLIKKELYLKNISTLELDNAKSEMISSVNTLCDSPGSIINYFFGMEVFKADNIDTKIKKINSVTTDDIKSLAKKIKIGIVYFLKGTNNEKI